MPPVPPSDPDGADRSTASGFDDLDAEERAERLEAALMGLHHLASLGRLVPRIAHDLKNELMVIQGNAALLEMAAARGGEPEAVDELASLAAIGSASARAGALIDQLRLHAHHGRLELLPVDVAQLVAQVRDVLVLSVPPGIELRLDVASGLPPVLADAGRLRELLLDLVGNAAEAMVDQGRVTVRARLADGHVELSVEDDGPGIEDRWRARVTESLFTTKPGHTGLGLSIVQDTVLAHDGTFGLVSSPAGTTVCVGLPAAIGASLAPLARESVVGATAPRAVASVAPRRGQEQVGGTVLVVDDDESLRTLVRRVLRPVGVTVLEAASSDEAISQHREHADIDLVLLDLSMPGRGGDAVHRELRDADPGLPVLILTGYSAPETRARFPDDAEVTLIHKPFDIYELRALVTTLLATNRGRVRERR